MKKILSLILALLMLFLCACNKSRQDQPDISYTAENVLPGVTMDLPEGYVRNEDNPEYPYYIKEMPEYNTFYTITLTTENTDNTFDSYTYYAKQKYEELDGYILFAEQNEEVNGVNVKILEFQYKVEYNTGTETFYCASGIFVDHMQVYVVTCISTKSMYDLERDAFLHCIRSLSV